MLATRIALAALAGLLTTSTAWAADPPAPAAPAPAVKPLECDASPLGLNGTVAVKVDPATEWQPRGGEIRFKVTGKPEAMAAIAPTACFRWSGSDTAAKYIKARIRLVETKSDTVSTTATYAATVPDLDPTPSSWFDRILHDGRSLGVRFDNTFVVPMAEMRVLVAGTALGTGVDESPTVGITSVWNARVSAAIALLAALLVMNRWARRRNVPGNNPVLRLVSTQAGYASLSQFQIVLWSFLFGGGAVYVFTLSGGLLDIPSGALVLLGIAGATTVGSKIQSNNEEKRRDAPPSGGQSAAPAAPPAVPGAMGPVAASGASAAGMGLSWAVPAAGGPVEFYRVEYAPTGTFAWQLASATVGTTSYRVRGLMPNQVYDFQVTATNASGAGTPSPIVTAPTLAPNVEPTREPQWSDLVVTPVHPGEIDVSRMQMLLFTLISAGFVAVKLLDSYVIPAIPDGFMLLMGITNGIYLTSKFATKP